MIYTDISMHRIGDEYQLWPVNYRVTNQMFENQWHFQAPRLNALTIFNHLEYYYFMHQNC